MVNIEIHAQSAKTGQPEFLYWKGLFLEAQACGIAPQELYPLLRKSQINFDEAETEKQLKYHVIGHAKPFRNSTLEKLFPGMDVSRKTKPASSTSIPGTWEVRVEMEPKQNATLAYIMRPNGVFYEQTRYVKSQNDYQSDETPVWTFDNIKPVELMREDVGKNTQFLITVEVDGTLYREKAWKELNDELYEQGYCTASRHKQAFSSLLNKYVKVFNIPVTPFARQAGFTKDGWRMPDKYHVKFTELQDEMEQGLKDLVKIEIPDIDLARQHYVDLYDAVAVKEKDIAFAWGQAAPFMNVLVPTTDLVPYLFMYSPEGDTGKSWLGNCVTAKIWNNYDPNHVAITKDQFNSEARANNYLSGSIFGICLEDIQGLTEKVDDILKSHFTGTGKYTRLTNKGKVNVDKDMDSPVTASYNDRPEFMSEPAALQRGIEISPGMKMTTADKAKFKKAYGAFPRGETGMYIYLLTKDWKLADVLERFEQIPNWEDAPDSRANETWRLWHFGALLFKEFFGIELDLTDLPGYILATREIVSVDWVDIITTQIRDGKRKEITIGFGENSRTEERFSPENKWIKHEILECSEGDACGYLYTSMNLKDMINGLHMGDKIKLPALLVQLENGDGAWKEIVMVKNKKIKVGKKWEQHRGIFIPEKAVFLTDAEKEKQDKEQRKKEKTKKQAQDKQDKSGGNPPTDEEIAAVTEHVIQELFTLGGKTNEKKLLAALDVLDAKNPIRECAFDAALDALEKKGAVRRTVVKNKKYIELL